MRRKISVYLLPLLAVILIAFSVGFWIGRNESSRDSIVIQTERPAAAELPEVNGTEKKTSAETKQTDADETTETASQTGEKIDLNTANLEQLQTLPGVGEVIAQRILDYRSACGGFLTIEQLMEVNGIGEAKFSKMKDLVTVEDAS